MKKKTAKAATKRGVVSATVCSASLLSVRIARDIMTVHWIRGPIRCQRAVMMRGKYPDREINMGGRNIDSIASVVKQHLIASGYPPNTVDHRTLRSGASSRSI